MIPKSITLRNLPAHAATTLDLDALPDGLIAIVGPNGSGKTTLMEAMGPTAIFGRSPSYSCEFGDLVGPAGGAITLTGEHDGREWVITRSMSSTRKHDVRLRIGGTEIETMGRVGDFDAEIAARFMPRALYLASIYAAQDGEGSFIGLQEAKQRDLFATLLGIEAMQERSTQAARVAAAAADAIGTIDRDITSTTVRASRFAELRAEEPQREQEAKDAADAGLAAARQRELMREAHDRAATQTAGLMEHIQTETAALAVERVRHDAARHERIRLEELVNAAQVATARVADLAAVEDRRAELAAAETSHEAATQAVRTNKRMIDALRLQLLQLQALQQRRADAQALETERADLMLQVRATNEVVAAREGFTAAAERELQAAADALRQHDTSTAEQLASAQHARERAALAAQLLANVPCGGRALTDGQATVDCGACPLLGDANTQAGSLRELTERIADLAAPGLRAELADALNLAKARREACVAAHREALDQANDLQLRLSAVNGRLHSLGDTSTDPDLQLPHIERELEDLQAARPALLDRQSLSFDEIRTRSQALQSAATAAGVACAVDDLPNALQTLRDTAAQLPALRERLAGTIASADALSTTMAARQDRIASLKAQLPPEDHVAQLSVALAAAVDASREAEARCDSATRELEGLRGRLAELGDAPGRLEALNASRRRLERLRTAYDLLAVGLGRKGLQAHEIDNAGPTVSGLVNDLLAACYGPRFTMELVTQQQASGRKVEKEVFDLAFWDANTGTRRSFNRLSGGERVIVNEALKLALALLTSRKSDFRCLALFRDEVDGDLDAANADRYPLLLRRAAEIGGFRRVFFISHRPEVHSQADARIILGGDSPVLEVS